MWSASSARIISHDPANELTGWSESGTSTAAWWDANGKWQGDGVTSFVVHNADNQLLSLITPTAASARTESPEGLEDRTRLRLPGSVDEAFLMIDLSLPAGDRERWAHPNRLGSTLVISDSTGAVVDTHTYSPFGQSGEGDGGFPFRFTGQKLDPETGLYYYKARYYDPELGRFLQTDPIGYADQMNLYAYVGNDPVNVTDSSGMVQEAGVNLFNLGIARAVRDDVDMETAILATNEDMKAEITYYANFDLMLATGDEGADVSFNFAVETIGGLIPSGLGSSVTYPQDGLGSIDGGIYSAGLNVGVTLNDLSGFHSPATTYTADLASFGGALSTGGDDMSGAAAEVSIWGYGFGLSKSQTQTQNFISLRTPWSPGFEEHGALQIGPSEYRLQGVTSVSGRIESNNIEECGARRC